jgi:hypothetical protein
MHYFSGFDKAGSGRMREYPLDKLKLLQCITLVLINYDVYSICHVLMALVDAAFWVSSCFRVCCCMLFRIYSWDWGCFNYFLLGFYLNDCPSTGFLFCRAQIAVNIFSLNIQIVLKRVEWLKSRVTCVCSVHLQSLFNFCGHMCKMILKHDKIRLNYLEKPTWTCLAITIFWLSEVLTLKPSKRLNNDYIYIWLS